MTNFEFIEHQYLPEDNYTKEFVILSLDNKYRIAFVRKERKDGRLYWDAIQSAVVINGEKKYLGIEFDSNFLKKDIEKFLSERPWEKNISSEKKASPMQNVQYAPVQETENFLF